MSETERKASGAVDGDDTNYNNADWAGQQAVNPLSYCREPSIYANAWHIHGDELMVRITLGESVPSGLVLARGSFIMTLPDFQRFMKSGIELISRYRVQPVASEG